jgi:hypothetical protein
LSDDWRIDYDDLEIVAPLARGNFAEVHRLETLIGASYAGARSVTDSFASSVSPSPVSLQQQGLLARDQRGDQDSLPDPDEEHRAQ